MERRLATILAADVVGYSLLVHADEEGTLRTLSAYREVIDELVAAATSALMKLSYSRPSSRFFRRLQAEISRSEIIAMKATQAPATRPRPVSALVSAI